MNRNQHEDDPEVIRACATGVGVLLAALALPGFLVGALLAELLHRRRLSWTWALVALVLIAPVLALILPDAVHALTVAAEQHASTLKHVDGLVGLLWPFWLAVAPLTTAVCKLRRDHRSRITSGAPEKREDNKQYGPLDFLDRRRHNRRSREAGPIEADGVLLGADLRGRLTRVPKLVAHALIVGGSNSGKTNTAEVLLEGHVAAGAGFVVLDGKGGRSLARTAVALGAQYDRPVALWSVSDYGDPVLDALRLAWDPTAEGNPTEIKDRIASSEEQSDPYYAAIAQRGLLMAARALTVAHGAVSLDRLATCLETPDRLKVLLRDIDDPSFAGDRLWLESLTDKERSGLRGMGLRLRTMVDSDGGHWLLPTSDGQEISLYRAVTEGWLVVFTLPQGTYPELIPQVTRYVMATLNSVCTRLESEGRTADSVVFVDELSGFNGDQFASAYERARSAGLSIVVATQSLSNLETAGGIKLLDGALDNSELMIIHRQTVPKAAEMLAGVIGTEQAWEHTHQVQDGRGLGSARGIEFGVDESGQRARRLTDRFSVHPNDIKKLDQGQAIVLSLRQPPSRRWWQWIATEQRDLRIRVRPGLSARPTPQAS